MSGMSFPSNVHDFHNYYQALCKCLYITVLKYRFVIQINNRERSCHFAFRKLTKCSHGRRSTLPKARFESYFLFCVLFGLFSCDTFFFRFKDERSVRINFLQDIERQRAQKRETEKSESPFLFHNFPITKFTFTPRNSTLTIDIIVLQSFMNNSLMVLIKFSRVFH